MIQFCTQIHCCWQQIHIDSGPYLINVSMHRQKFIYVFTEMLYPTTWILKVLHIDSLLVTMQHSSIFSTMSNTGSYDKTLLYILNWNHIFNESILLIFSYKFVVDDNAVFVSFQGLTSLGAGFWRKIFLYVFNWNHISNECNFLKFCTFSQIGCRWQHSFFKAITDQRQDQGAKYFWVFDWNEKCSEPL